ncbi:MAG: hypothetical protein ACRECH_15325 [Nitrososphaerales archaeon]
MVTRKRFMLVSAVVIATILLGLAIPTLIPSIGAINSHTVYVSPAQINGNYTIVGVTTVGNGPLYNVTIYCAPVHFVYENRTFIINNGSNLTLCYETKTSNP